MAHHVNVGDPHPVCPICGSRWKGLDDGYAQHVWCSAGHKTMWRAQRGGLTLEAGDYEVRWNCDCAVPECFGRNVIYEAGDDVEDERFIAHDLPFKVTDDDVRRFVESATWEYPK